MLMLIPGGVLIPLLKEMKKKLDDAGIKTKKEDIKEVTILFDDGRKLVIKKPIFYVINVRGSLIYQIQIK